MISIPVPSESCPHCRMKGGTCHVIISYQIPITREREKDFLIELGKKPKNINAQVKEAYMVDKFLCLNK